MPGRPSTVRGSAASLLAVKCTQYGIRLVWTPRVSRTKPLESPDAARLVATARSVRLPGATTDGGAEMATPRLETIRSSETPHAPAPPPASVSDTRLRSDLPRWR